MSKLQEAMQETSKAQIEMGEFQISTMNLLNTKLQNLVAQADDEERPKIQDLLNAHTKQVGKLEVETQMFKFFDTLISDETKT